MSKEKEPIPDEDSEPEPAPIPEPEPELTAPTSNDVGEQTLTQADMEGDEGSEGTPA